MEDEEKNLADNGIRFRCDLAWVDTNEIPYLSAVSKKKFFRLLQHFKATASDACCAREASCVAPTPDADKDFATDMLGQISSFFARHQASIQVIPIGLEVARSLNFPAAPAIGVLLFLAVSGGSNSTNSETAQ